MVIKQNQRSSTRFYCLLLSSSTQHTWSAYNLETSIYLSIYLSMSFCTYLSIYLSIYINEIYGTHSQEMISLTISR